MPELIPSEQSLTEVPCDALVCAAFSREGGIELSSSAQEIDRALEGYLSEYAAEANFKARRSEILVLPTQHRMPAKSIALVGLGRRSEADAAGVRRAAGAAAKRLNEKRVIASALHSEIDDSLGAATEGFLIGSHRSPSYKADPDTPKLQRIEVLNAAAGEIERGVARARATTLARDLVNEPASVLTPDVFARRARDLADTSGLQASILDEKELEGRGFGGILAVARGSDVPPRLIELRYVPERPKGRVVLVGKGVTFDSGGLSLKDARNMETMKTDMGGGAAVVGAMGALAALGIRDEVIALIPTTENMPGGSALRPGDVIYHYGGRTTEVLNTDAEGRLILADAIAYAGEMDPEVIVDVATLTGSMTIALGREIAGVFANDDGLWEEIRTASERSGEAMWRMPLHDAYDKSLESDIADSKNIGARYGGAIVAALYLQHFVPKGIPWAHLDIAGSGRAESAGDLSPKGGTGVAARTLLQWLEGRNE